MKGGETVFESLESHRGEGVRLDEGFEPEDERAKVLPSDTFDQAIDIVVGTTCGSLEDREGGEGGKEVIGEESTRWKESRSNVQNWAEIPRGLS